jgi:hypothetical protein
MKYFYVFTSIICLLLSIILEWEGRHIESMIAFLVAILAFGIDDILDELKKNNEQVIVRDPKTGRFKKC